MHPKPTKPTLEIHPTPFKPSHLSIPPSPFSPRTPLPLSPHQPPSPRLLPTPDTRYTPPSPPLQWLWQCHHCRRTYSLGVTRRCLEDGHAFCAGQTTVKAWRRPLRAARVKRHKACASEFDYAGWKAWGRWKRSGRRESISYGSFSSEEEEGEDSSSDESTQSSSDVLKDCWNTCDYPSECRWGTRFGIHTPVETAASLPSLEPLQPLPPAASGVSEAILKAENCRDVNGGKKGERTDFWGALVASATRRKNVPASSPLASVSDGCGEEVALRDGDGDVVMGSSADVEPAAALQSHPRTLAPTASPARVAVSASPVFTLKDIIRKGTKRTRSSSGLAEWKESISMDAYEKALSELPQLERVKSRDSGYHSTLEVEEFGVAI